EELDRLRAGFEKAGISSETMTEGLALIKQRIEAGMADFGIPLRATAAQITQFIENAIAEVSRMPEGVKQTQRAIELLGENLGIKLVAAIRKGSPALIYFRTATGTITREQQIQAAQQEQAINQMSAEWRRFQAAISAPIVVPVINFVISEIEKLPPALQQVQTEYQAWKNLIQAPLDLSNWQAVWAIIYQPPPGQPPILSFFTDTLPSAINTAIDALLRYLKIAEQLGGTPLPGGAPIGGPRGGRRPA